jgi:hypothetical protein
MEALNALGKDFTTARQVATRYNMIVNFAWTILHLMAVT